MGFLHNFFSYSRPAAKKEKPSVEKILADLKQVEFKKNAAKAVNETKSFFGPVKTSEVFLSVFILAILIWIFN